MFISKLFPCLRCTQRVEHIYLAYKPECLLLEAMNYYYLAYKLCTWYLAYKPDCLQDGAGLGGGGVKGPHCLLHRPFGFTTLTCSTEGVAMIFVVGALRLPQLWAHKVFEVHKKRAVRPVFIFLIFTASSLCWAFVSWKFCGEFWIKKRRFILDGTSPRQKPASWSVIGIAYAQQLALEKVQKRLFLSKMSRKKEFPARKVSIYNQPL